MIVLIDNGHGRNTPGKRSPDNTLLEWQWTREEAKLLASTLVHRGIGAKLLVPEDSDIYLPIRADRCNDFCALVDDEEVILISLHCDAQPGCEHSWGTARGLTSFVYTKAGHTSRSLASLITTEARDRTLLGNRSVPSCLYREQNLAILRETKCPAVLVECGFMTNRQDVAFMLSDYGRLRIVDAIAQAVQNYIKSHV